VLLEELGRPGEAAAAFAQADALAPDGPLAEDAVAREVEALSRGGDASGAARLAREYLRRFPDGRKVRSVKRFGGIE
jgi:transmembrane sensor